MSVTRIPLLLCLTFYKLDAASIKTELERLRAMDREREKKHNQKFKGPSDLLQW